MKNIKAKGTVDTPGVIDRKLKTEELRLRGIGGLL